MSPPLSGCSMTRNDSASRSIESPYFGIAAKALATQGTASLGALSTSLFTTGTGITAALLIGVMVHSLESGIDRSRR